MPRRSRTRSRRSLAAILGTAIAAAIAGWLGFGASPNNPPPSRNVGEARQPSEVNGSPGARSAEVENSPTGSGTDSPTGSGPARGASFDFYQLSLSLAPAFCELEPDHQQCDRLDAALDQQTPLTLHGLWPEYRGAGNYPSDCQGPNLSFASLDRQLDRDRRLRLMPGGNRLAGHEWRKHGSCSGLTSTEYFRQSLDLTEYYNRSLANFINELKRRDEKVTAADFRRQVDLLLGNNFSASINLSCRNLPKNRPRNLIGASSQRKGQAHLTELRICVEKGANNVPGAPIECAAFDRIDQGCGKSFYLDSP